MKESRIHFVWTALGYSALAMLGKFLSSTPICDFGLVVMICFLIGITSASLKK